MSEINKEAIREWVEALRSGEIEQATGNLGNVDGSRCCLGVVSDIAVKHGVLSAPFPNPHDPRQVAYDTETVLLPAPVPEWLGFGEYELDPMGSNGCSLSGHNDQGANFDEIADMIERLYLQDSA